MNEHLPGSKIAERLFSRPEGATMAEVIAATGGRQHNLLERLKARGYTVKSRKEGRTTRYWAVKDKIPSYKANVSAKGQVTIPIEVREQLGIRNGRGTIRFSIDDNGNTTLTRVTGSLNDLAGILGKPKRHLSLKDIDRIIGDAAVARFLRSTGRK